MIHIRGLVSETPNHRLSQQRVIELGRELLKGKVPFLEQTLGLFANAGVEQRFLARPIEEIFDHPDLGWRNQVYTQVATAMAVSLAQQALQQSALPASAIDMIITTSCTGFMIPAVDAHVINRLGMRPDIKRLPITELGCAAGAMGLSRGFDYLQAYPDQHVMLICIELPSLTYHLHDLRVANLVSAALFGDGGAACVLDGEPGLCAIEATQTHFFKNTSHLMGFELDAEGFKIMLDKRIPALVESHFAELSQAFLARLGWSPQQIKHFVFHPGGRRILDTLVRVLGIQEQDVQASRHVLREVGNLSSASVLFVLQRILQTNPSGPGLMAAFGPGFNAELLALRF